MQHTRPFVITVGERDTCGLDVHTLGEVDCIVRCSLSFIANRNPIAGFDELRNIDDECGIETVSTNMVRFVQLNRLSSLAGDALKIDGIINKYLRKSVLEDKSRGVTVND